MPKDLNSYTVEHLQYLFDLYNDRVLKTENEPDSFNSPAAALHVRMDNALSAALISYALDKKNQLIIDYLEKSLAACKNLLAESSNRFVDPLMMSDGMHIALILGKKQDALSIADHLPGDPGDYEQGSLFIDRVIMGYIHTLALLIEDRNTETSQEAMVLTRDNKSRKEEFVAAYLELIALLRIIAEKNQLHFEDYMRHIVQRHTIKSKTAELRESPQALICLKGLALTALGMDRGLTLQFKTDYLPLELLRSTNNIKNNPL